MKEQLLEIIKQKKESANADYNRFLQNQNAYQDKLLIIRGEIMAYMDLECVIRNMEVNNGK